MAPRSKVKDVEVEAGASESEDDLAPENKRANNTASRGSIAKTMPRRTSTAATKRKAAPKAQGRPPLKDRTNVQAGSDTEEVDNFEDENGGKPKAKRAKTTTTAKKQTTSRAGSAPAKSRTTKRAPAVDLSVIPETQADPNDVSQSIENDADNMDISTVPTPPRLQHFVQRARSTSVQPLQPRASARSVSAQPLLQPRPSARSVSAQPGYPPPRERSGSVSDTTRERRGGDPEMRRKITDMTKKYEDLNMKYQSLQEVGRNEADANFEKLKRAADQKTKDANELIASLKKELAEARKSSNSSSSDTSGMQKQISSLTTSNEKLKTENADIKSSLQAAQNETKSLEAKLVAARQQLSHSASTQEKPSNSATTRNDLSRSAGPNATDAQKEAKMKENLYSDLTGLIIRGVKMKDAEDEYDCIQTGRNGTLHFHLTVANDSSVTNPKTPSGLSFEESEFVYEPLLDESRDRDLMELLPDYLTEEICFPRNHAVKFYTRVVDSMTRKIIVEEE
ncbi:hypothetical protein LTR37_021048 [Vermiconidia calcicola]|uniref:Uncharacterized protein n=1 Tax=Vermiconidia calcicola TaxID=1690605 RepID=A0ACC3M9U4_9PEZI|nr:hypothetical protein LTR37_021048 [Vermiconidia calcicola]